MSKLQYHILLGGYDVRINISGKASGNLVLAFSIFSAEPLRRKGAGSIATLISVSLIIFFLLM